MKRKQKSDEVRGQLPLRVTEEEKAQFQKAAGLENLPTGTWIRKLALAEAKRLIQNDSR
jgi:uncharacterized protein (DUF1778 family)